MLTITDALVLHVRDFTRTPGPRFRNEGPYSGEQFREGYLLPKFDEAERSKKKLVVILDDTSGYASSFLEEAFGGLAREKGVEAVQRRIELVSDTRPWYVSEVEGYIAESAE